jgi:hypothetical protein
MNTSHEESTYALIIRSEEKGRIVLNTVLYALLLLSVVYSICEFAIHPVTVPAAAALQCVACETRTVQHRSHI